MSEVFRNYLNTVRRDFADSPLDFDHVGDDPFAFFEKWFDEAVGAEVMDPYAMSIATVDRQGQPSVRVVYMRDISKDGLVFYTNYLSSKGKDLAQNPKISANFFWVELDRQIRVKGKVALLSEAASDVYFASRPRESQLGAWASDQSRSLKNREELTDRLEALRQRFEGKDIPRPSHWGGYCIAVESMEFWQGRPSRLHDRVVFTMEGSIWKKSRLSP